MRYRVKGIFGKDGFVSRYGILFVLLLLILFFSLLSNAFFSTNNLFNIARQISMLGIVAVGMTAIMITGGIDLSVGSLMALSGVICSFLMVKMGIHPIFAVLITLVAGSVVGFINGIIITNIGIPPLITTLGMMTIARGVSFIITSGLPIYNIPEKFRFLGQGYIGKFPFPVIIMIVIFILGGIVLNGTYWGRYFYAIGGNEDAARLSGVNVKKYKVLVYVGGSLLTSLAGIILLSRINSGQPTAGSGFELDVVTAVVLGGVSISGGEGKLFKVLIGVLIIGVLSNGLIILSVGEYYQSVIKGCVLLLAVGFDRLSFKQTK